MIRAAVYGFGYLGHAVCDALQQAPDLTVCGVYSRRAARLLPHWSEPFALWEADAFFSHPPTADVVINCGGSAADLPQTTPALAERCCVVDSFDCHAAIAAHRARTDTAARAAGTLCIISAGWDPGLFSLARLLGSAFVPQASISTFWGPGVSQGHSDALRRLPGVADARQYTIPLEEALTQARAGRAADAMHSHRRICYIVPTPDADRRALEQAIRSMPGYFAGYETEIHFITAQQMKAQHSRMPHGGHVICTGGGDPQRQPALSVELQLSLGSNTAFTAGILTACARAAVRLRQAGQTGCRTMAEIPPACYLPRPEDAARWL